MLFINCGVKTRLKKNRLTMEEGKMVEGFFFPLRQKQQDRGDMEWGWIHASCQLTPSHPPSSPHPPPAFCPPFLTATSSGWDWSSSRLPQTGLRVPMAPAILWGFGSVTAAWLIYGTLITPPPGGLRGARRVTSGERGETLCLYMGIILGTLPSGQPAPSTDKRF